MNRDANALLHSIFRPVIDSVTNFVPRGKDDDERMKQTYLDMIKTDPVVTTATLRFFRYKMSSHVENYMKRLVLQMPEIVSETQAVQEDYFEKIFDGRTFEKVRFGLKL